MPIKQASKKSLRQTRVRTLRNLQQKNKIKDLAKKIIKGLTNKETAKIQEWLRSYQQAIDKAVKSGWLKPNAGNRKKSRLAAQVKKLRK